MSRRGHVPRAAASPPRATSRSSQRVAAVVEGRRQPPRAPAGRAVHARGPGARVGQAGVKVILATPSRVRNKAWIDHVFAPARPARNAVSTAVSATGQAIFVVASGPKRDRRPVHGVAAVERIATRGPRRGAIRRESDRRDPRAELGPGDALENPGRSGQLGWRAGGGGGRGGGGLRTADEGQRRDEHDDCSSHFGSPGGTGTRSAELLDHPRRCNSRPLAHWAVSSSSGGLDDHEPDEQQQPKRACHGRQDLGSAGIEHRRECRGLDRRASIRSALLDLCASPCSTATRRPTSRLAPRRGPRWTR